MGHYFFCSKNLNLGFNVIHSFSNKNRLFIVKKIFSAPKFVQINFANFISINFLSYKEILSIIPADAM